MSESEKFYGNDTGPGRGTNVFLTGGTGFLGDLLIRKYLERTDCSLWVLSRPMGGATAEERILDRFNPRDHHRIRVIAGDLGCAFDEGDDDSKLPSGFIDIDTKESYESFLDMLKVVDEVFHNASYLGLRKDLRAREKCISVNIQGTRRLLSLVGSFKQKLKALFYTSTAFVHGNISGPGKFGEDTSTTNGWLNPYEESKWKAEELIRNAGYPYRIFRPGMIAREPGADILSSHTIYGVADILQSGCRSYRAGQYNGPIHLRVKGTLDAAHNIILRSELVDMILDIRDSGHTMNHTYNTLNTTNTLLDDVLYSIVHNLNPEITYEFVPDIDQGRDLNHIEVLMDRLVYPLYQGYLFKKSPEFRMDNVVAALGKEYIRERITKIDRALMVELMKDYFEAKNNG